MILPPKNFIRALVCALGWQLVLATAAGARLHCVFQRLDGEATGEGLWLVSTVTNHPGDRFRVKAVEVGRALRCAPALASDTNGGQRTARPTTGCGGRIKMRSAQKAVTKRIRL